MFDFLIDVVRIIMGFCHYRLGYIRILVWEMLISLIEVGRILGFDGDIILNSIRLEFLIGLYKNSSLIL